MNFLDAPYEVLKMAKKPLHYSEITAKAMAKGWLDTKGQTPEATMGARLYIDIKKEHSRFQLISKGVFTLVDAPSPDIRNHIDAINAKTRDDLRKQLMSMSPGNFEVLITELLRAVGFDENSIERTPISGDGGIDVRGVLSAKLTKINAAVQAKRHKKNIRADVVRALRGSLTVHEQGIIITTSKFSPGAIKESQAPGKTPISLIDGEQLLNLLIEHKIGVSHEEYTVHSLDEDWWNDVFSDSKKVEKFEKASVQKVGLTFPYLIQGKAHGETFYAELLDSKGHIRYSGIEYNSPSKACMEIAKWKSCNGWIFWQYQHPETGNWHSINELRE